MKYRYYILTFLLWKSILSYGQTVLPGTEVQELVKIADIYENIPSLSFHMRYTFADTLTWQDLTDSMHAECKISYGRSLVTNDSMELLKGSEYFVMVDKADSFIMAMPIRSHESIFQMPLLDPVFRKAHVSSMHVYEYSDSAWRFKIIFNPNSFYSFFEMDYDPRTGLIRFVNYHARNEIGNHDIPSDHAVCAYIYMTDYSGDELDPALFNEHRFIYRLNGVLYLQPAWQEFEFENY